MKCTDIREGSYDCCYNIIPLIKTDTTPDWRYIAVDKCLMKKLRYEVFRIDSGLKGEEQ